MKKTKTATVVDFFNRKKKLADLFALLWSYPKELFSSICVSSNEQLVKRTAKNARTQLLFAERMVM
jgi:hypothetical protein